MKQSSTDRSWLKEVMDDARRDIPRLPEAIRRLPPRSQILEQLRAARSTKVDKQETTLSSK